MPEGIDKILEDTDNSMNKALLHLESELGKIRAGKANPNIVDGIMADYYGNPTPVNQIANISVLDARTISVQPWEKSMLSAIERAIIQANIGINPQSDGNVIRLFMPPLTEERRREMVKRSNAEGEHARIAVRNIRRDSIEGIKKLQKDGLSEDAGKDGEKDIQGITDKYVALIEKHLAAKEKEIMAV